MYSKIAMGNVKKSFKDYTIYFLTLTLAVCIFYTFNSIESQKAIIEMQKSGKTYADTLINIIGYVSVFVSVILGSLILYANNFLIKKRKKELGIYMTLGMGKEKISRILIMETLLVGAISLVSGLLLGVIVSQGLSIFTSKLFEVGMNEYSFVLSTAAIGKTILYFGIMFLLVMIFNSVIISKYKIIELLTAGRKNEDIKFKNQFVYLIAFILCLVSLGASYKIVLKIGLRPDSPMFFMSIILGVIGTVLFFFSLAGFILFMVKRSKKVYFKGLNIFVVKQLNSKVNTNFLSISMICLMLFMTIGVLSTGLSFKSTLEKGLADSTPFDASANMYVQEDDAIKSVEESLNKIGFKFDEDEKYSSYNVYDSNIKAIDMFGKNISEKNKKILEEVYSNVDVIKLSEYNNIRKLNNKDEVTLNDNEVLLLNNAGLTVSAVEEFFKSNKTLNFNEKEFIIKNKEIIKDNLNTDAMKNILPTLVVNDQLTNNLSIKQNVLNINFSEENKDKSDKKFSELFNDFRDGKIDYDNTGFVIGYTKNQIYEENKSITTTILFVGIYLGIVFLITSMAVLALQQLSEASDSIDRYKSLKKIGANDKMINKTIFTQTLVYFTLPIILALIHSVVGIRVANDFIASFEKPDIGGSSMITAVIFIIIYIGYFFATYSGYKNIVKNNL